MATVQYKDHKLILVGQTLKQIRRLKLHSCQHKIHHLREPCTALVGVITELLSESQLDAKFVKGTMKSVFIKRYFLVLLY